MEPDHPGTEEPAVKRVGMLPLPDRKDLSGQTPRRIDPDGQRIQSGQRRLVYPPVLPGWESTICQTWTCLARKPPASERR